jgi:tetratricopeptide (TPR) repeat protein
MFRRLLFFLSLASGLAAQQLDVDPRLFSVIAAVNAAGYDAEIDSPNNHPLRQAVRDYVAKKNPSVLPELRRFFAEHKQQNPAQELSQYISFALSTRAVPEFEYRFNENELPPDVLRLAGFQSLISRFHREADMDGFYKQNEAVFETALQRYQEPASRMMNEVNGYMRNPGITTMGRTFRVYVDLLGSPNQIHYRNYQEDFFVVVTPSADPQVEYLRNAYFKFMIDPLTSKYVEELNEKKGLIDYAQASEALDEHYKTDFLLLTGASLSKAIEARLARASVRTQMVEAALKEGYILTPAFAELLPEYEKQEQSLRLYFPELIKGINLRKEAKRLEAVDFVKTKPVRKARVVEAPAPAPPQLSGVAKAIDDADLLIEKRDLAPARELLLGALKQSDEKKWHGRAYFGLARIATLQKDPETGFKLFETTLETSPEGSIQAWAHYYLGRLSELSSAPEDAIRHFDSALATQGISPKTRSLVEQALAAAKKGRQ